MNFDLTENAVVSFLPPAIGIALLSLQAWFGRRFADRSAVDAVSGQVDMLAEQVDAHHHQLLVIQEAVKHLPTSGEMHRIEIGLTALRGETNAQTGILTGLARKVELIDESLKRSAP